MTENPFAKQKKKKFKKWKNSKRNLPNELNEGKLLNINAKAFVPKMKALPNNGNNQYYPQYINTMSNSNKYYAQPYCSNYIYQAKNNNSDFYWQYKNSYQLENIKNGFGYIKNQYSQTNPFSKSNYISQQDKEINKRYNRLKITNSSFIPKSMREKNNKPSEDVITSLNEDAPEYIPQNEA